MGHFSDRVKVVTQCFSHTRCFVLAGNGRYKKIKYFGTRSDTIAICTSPTYIPPSYRFLPPSPVEAGVNPRLPRCASHE